MNVPGLPLILHLGGASFFATILSVFFGSTKNKPPFIGSPSFSILLVKNTPETGELKSVISSQYISLPTEDRTTNIRYPEP